MAATRGLILVVDDSLPDRDMLSRRLQRAGCTTVMADGGEEALKIIERQEVDVVLLDVTMPGMDGLTVLEKVRQSRSMTELPIIIVTARDDNTDIRRGFQLGANDYLTKPVDFPVVLSRVQTQLLVKKLSVEVDAARNRMKRELQMASRLQRSLIPRVSPSIRSVNFSWGFYPCEQVAGDNLDILQLDSNHIGCYLLDVSGRGIEAALLALTLSRALSHMAPDSLLFKRTSSGEIEIVPPAAVASALNRRFPMHSETRQYFALLYGVLNVEQRTFRYVSAGHFGAVRVAFDRPPSALPSGGCPIGWFKDCAFEETVIDLEYGDRLYVCSDGLTNASNNGGDCYSDRFIATLHEAREQSLDSSLDGLFYEVREWCGQTPPADDITVLAFEVSR